MQIHTVYMYLYICMYIGSDHGYNIILNEIEQLSQQKDKSMNNSSGLYIEKKKSIPLTLHYYKMKEKQK